ncbi:MAG: hypothetical protein EDM05_56165 [Leptolyngbya sp. IPPAS B-1204]|nr:MAG: hypothetical protein EDM05_08105 [Leptolyngbya sp. IPPAS B-1204]
MRFGQIIAGLGIGVGLTAGALGGWAAFQQWQNQAPQPINYSNASQSVPQPERAVPASQPAPIVALSQAENDYLYDLSQALQSVEHRRLTNAERLAIGRQIAGWLQTGSRYWDVRSQFDQVYKTAVAGDYAYNRDVYIKFATERLAPGFVSTLTPPQPEPQVILKTRTEYVESPGRTKVIKVPEPFPVPVPYPVPGGGSSHVPDYPDHPGHPGHPDYPDHPSHPGHPEEPSHPSHPGDPEEPDHPADPHNPDAPVGSEPPGQVDPGAGQPAEPDVIVTDPVPEQPPAQPAPEQPPVTGEAQPSDPAPSQPEAPNSVGSGSVQTSEVSY